MMIGIVSLFGLAIPVGLILLVAGIIRANKASSRKTIHAVYLYIIISASLLMIIFGFMATIFNVLNILLPEQVIDYGASDAVWAAQQQLNARNGAITGAVTSSAGALIGLVLFLIHNRLAKEMKNT